MLQQLPTQVSGPSPPQPLPPDAPHVLMFSVWFFNCGFHSAACASEWGRAVLPPTPNLGIPFCMATPGLEGFEVLTNSPVRYTVMYPAPGFFSAKTSHTVCSLTLGCLGFSILRASASLSSLQSVIIPQSMFIPPSPVHLRTVFWISLSLYVLPSGIFSTTNLININSINLFSVSSKGIT